MINKKEIEAVILAGGKSSRMGRDKGLIPLHGKPLIAYVIDLAKYFDFPVRIISQNKEYEKFGYPVIPDLIPEKGPIGGLYTALKTTTYKHILLLSCDSPYITGRVIQALIEKGSPGKITVSLFRNRLYPLCAIYPKNIIKLAEENICMNDLKMTSLIQRTPHVTASLSTLHDNVAEVLVNINTPEDLTGSSKIKYYGN